MTRFGRAAAALASLGWALTLAAQAPAQAPPLRMNDILVVGTHNSYKRAIPPNEMLLLRQLRGDAVADTLDYSHGPLAEQLDDGARTLELDVYIDAEGGRYADPLLPRLAKTTAPHDPALKRPGYKVMHAADTDGRSQCTLFVDCLRTIKAWSDRHPSHVPILILINAKDTGSSLEGAVKVLTYDAKAYDALDAEVRSVLGPGDLITPDTVRGAAPSLRAAVTGRGWPTLAQARGKVFFALDESPAKVALYRGGRKSLEGRVMFVNGDETSDDAAYLTLNDPVADATRIRRAVAAGLIVRTRADADTAEARRGSAVRREAALASGAQYVSTDYMTPDPRFPPYQARLPGRAAAVCNPVRAAGRCGSGPLESLPDRR
jgi:hypothetical protein